jgi:hypothetical protein
VDKAALHIGAVAFIHRFGSSLNEHVHFHICVVDGVFEEVVEFPFPLGRLAVLVPRPRINLLLYHGVLGARAAWRAEVVPRQAPSDGCDPASREAEPKPTAEAAPAETVPRVAHGATWADRRASGQALMSPIAFDKWLIRGQNRPAKLIRAVSRLSRPCVGGGQCLGTGELFTFVKRSPSNVSYVSYRPAGLPQEAVLVSRSFLTSTAVRLARGSAAMKSRICRASACVMATRPQQQAPQPPEQETLLPASCTRRVIFFDDGVGKRLRKWQEFTFCCRACGYCYLKRHGKAIPLKPDIGAHDMP